jgi:hypothetical protein
VLVADSYLTQLWLQTHNLLPTYDFHNYMIRSMEEEFEKIVGVRFVLHRAVRLHAWLLRDHKLCLTSFFRFGYFVEHCRFDVFMFFLVVECCGVSLLLSCYLILMVITKSLCFIFIKTYFYIITIQHCKR